MAMAVLHVLTSLEITCINSSSENHHSLKTLSQLLPMGFRRLSQLTWKALCWVKKAMTNLAHVLWCCSSSVAHVTWSTLVIHELSSAWTEVRTSNLSPEITNHVTHERRRGSYKVLEHRYTKQSLLLRVMKMMKSMKLS